MRFGLTAFSPPLFAALRRFSAAEQIEGKSAAPRVHAICTPPTRPAFTGAFSRLGTSGTSTLPPPPPPHAAAGVTHTYGSLLQRLQAGLSSHCFFFFFLGVFFFLFIHRVWEAMSPVPVKSEDSSRVFRHARWVGVPFRDL